MPQDAFTLRHIARELDGALAGGRINKINQPDRDSVSLLIYTGKRTVKLLLNANATDCGAYFDETDAENPPVAPNFCMLLRKYILGAAIERVELVNFERILAFRLACSSDFTAARRVLYAEIMGKYSNLILTEEGRILGALRTTSLDDSFKRTVFPGMPYELPAPQDKVSPLDGAALAAALDGAPASDVAETVFARVAGLAPVTARQIAACYRGGSLAEHVKAFIFSDETAPCVTGKAGAETDFCVRGEGVPFPTVLAAETHFYRVRRERRRREDARRRLLAAVNGAAKKQEKRLAQAEEKLLACADAETLRVKGELLTANLYRIEKGSRGCELENYYGGGTLRIALDPTLTPAQNAQKYFKQYRKLKRAAEVLVPQKEETLRELAYLGSLRAAVERAESAEDFLSLGEECAAAGLVKEQTKKKSAAPIPFRTFEKDGFRIDAGRNNLQNDRLVRSAAPDDLWLHAQKRHSAHVVIRAEGRSVPEGVIAFAAAVCARYAEGGGDRIPVDVCPVRNVKKPPKAKAGFVVYSGFSTVLGDPSALMELRPVPHSERSVSEVSES